MATFNVVVSDPASGHSVSREVEGQDANRLLGREIGEEVDGGAVGLEGFTVEITGGSDAAGRPLRGDVRGSALKEILTTGGTGYHPNRDGERKRVTVRGREISDAVAQINVAVAGGDGDPLVALGVKEPDESDDEEEEVADEDADAEDDDEEAEAAEDEEEAADDAEDEAADEDAEADAEGDAEVEDEGAEADADEADADEDDEE